MENFFQIQHASVLVNDTQQSLAFYCGILGMSEAPRPDLGFPGAWLQVGDQQIHLLELPNPDPVHGRPEHGGRDRHIALTVASLETLINRLETNHISYTRSGSGRAAVFLRDPDGNTLECIEMTP